MTALTPEETDVLKHLLAALGDAGQEFIIAGGQAARLFRFHPLAQPLAWQPILTQDIDVATIDKGHRAERDIGEALEREGFASHLDGEDVPPLTHYRLGTSEVEFIVPDIPRRNTTGATVSVLGASAQKVANLEPLLVQPIELIIPDVGSVRLPNPAAYLIQKVLTLSARRTLGKKGKDALYVHDVLLLFTHGNRLHPEIVASARRVLGTLTKKQVKRLRENAQKLGDAGVDFVVESARQAEGRQGHSVQAIALANKLGLQDLLDEPGPQSPAT